MEVVIMVNPLFSIGGISSGLDTTGIIDQLMSIERQPIVRFQQSQQSLRNVDAAWSRIIGKMSSFRSALDDVRNDGAISGLTAAVSDDEDAVAVSNAEGGEAGSLSFTVAALASRHRVGFDGSYGSASALVEAGTVELFDETGGSAGSITTDGTTTLDDLADAISALDVGVKANVLKVSEGNYQLIMASSETGLEGQFSATTDIASLSTTSIHSSGGDAHLQVGGLDVYRSSNTFSDLVPGATIHLKTVTSSDVTVSVEQDLDEAVTKIAKLVTTANEILAQLAKDTKYDTETGASGYLQGDSLARDLAFDIRDTFTQVVSGGSISYAGEIGISLTREGTVKLDEAALRTSLEDDASGVARFMSASLTGDANTSIAFTGSDAASGPFTMSVSQSASVAAATGATFVPPTGGDETFTITTSTGDDVAVNIADGMSATQAVARINAALDASGSTGLLASVVDDGAGGEAVRLATSGYGSGATFTVAGSAQGLDGAYTGTDVIADFGNGAVTGSGRSIAGDGAATGLTLRVASGIGSYDMTYSTGFAGLLDTYLSSLEGVDGRIQTQRDSISGRITDFDDQIEAFEQRLILREGRLRKQFTTLETSLARLQSQGSWLSSAMGGS
ncbi:MAG: flagellar hook-associated protein 2 [Nitriliruptoraceae bacterium]|jgi:flagellar hook-associated protein 2